MLLNKTCSPTLDHFKLVNVLAPVWVPDQAGLFKFRSYGSEKCRIDVAVSPDNMIPCFLCCNWPTCCGIDCAVIIENYLFYFGLGWAHKINLYVQVAKYGIAATS